MNSHVFNSILDPQGMLLRFWTSRWHKHWTFIQTPPLRLATCPSRPFLLSKIQNMQMLGLHKPWYIQDWANSPNTMCLWSEMSHCLVCLALHKPPWFPRKGEFLNPNTVRFIKQTSDECQCYEIIIKKNFILKNGQAATGETPTFMPESRYFKFHYYTTLYAER